LLRFRDPRSGATLWITPGGALDPDEAYEGAALRELEEETGLRDVTLGPCVGRYEHRFQWNGQDYEQTDHFFAARIAHVPALTAPGLGPGEVLVATGWWHEAELGELDAAVSPPDLAVWLRLAVGAAPRMR
jgi:8-oxo-dGTP pyrophosphatase MutT (NUDIX family)